MRNHYFVKIIKLIITVLYTERPSSAVFHQLTSGIWNWLGCIHDSRLVILAWNFPHIMPGIYDDKGLCSKHWPRFPESIVCVFGYLQEYIGSVMKIGVAANIHHQLFWCVGKSGRYKLSKHKSQKCFSLQSATNCKAVADEYCSLQNS